MTIPTFRTGPTDRGSAWSPGASVNELPVIQPRGIGCRLEAHLRAWLGVWPPRRELDVIAWPGRDEPGWDGGRWLGLGVESPGGTVLSLSPTIVLDPRAIDAERVQAALRSPQANTAVPAALGHPDLRLTRAAFRWSAAPASLPPVGEWVDRHDPRLPQWMHAFNGGVLIVWDERGQMAAGVGIKRHNAHGCELAVGTEPTHQGKGLARALVVQAARRVLALDAVPLYFHDEENVPSGRVAAAAGFPDRGWHILGLLPGVFPAS